MSPELVRKKYGIDELARRIPADRAEFFRGFVPWAEDVQGWTLSTREAHPTAERTDLRTIWDNPGDPNTRILIDVAELRSAAEAIEALVAPLGYNQLDRLPDGPPNLGLASFAHPDLAPPAVFFVQGNLSILVSSFGRQPVAVVDAARRISARLAERPGGEPRPMRLEADGDRAQSGEAITFSIDVPVRLGVEGYVKFFVTGGVVTRSGDRFTLRRAAPGSVRVEAFAVEPGRETYAADLTVTFE